MIKIDKCRFWSLLKDEKKEFVSWFIEEHHDQYHEFKEAFLRDPKNCMNRWVVRFLASLTEEQNKVLSEKIEKYRGWHSYTFLDYPNALIFIQKLIDFQRFQVRRVSEKIVVDVKY